MSRITRTVFTLLISACLLLAATPAWAHFFLNDGDISAMVHVNPNDQPVAGQPSTIIFYLSHRNGGFSPNNYKGAITINIGGRKLQSVTALGPKGKAEASLNYTFANPGIYLIRLRGRSIRKGVNSFTLSFYQRVIGTNGTGADYGWVYWAAGGSLIIWLAIALLDPFLPAITNGNGNSSKERGKS